MNYSADCKPYFELLNRRRTKRKITKEKHQQLTKKLQMWILIEQYGGIPRYSTTF